MIPKSILQRMGIGFASAGAMLALHGPNYVMAGETTPPPSPSLSAELKLSVQNVSALKLTIRQLGADDFRARVLASKTICEMGAATVSHLKDALPLHKDPEIRVRLQRLIEQFESKNMEKALFQNVTG